MPRAAAEVGSTANSYQILARLATGGMAEIFLARGEGVAGVERYCVLKRILPDRASDVQFVRMFLDEARLVAQLQHPHIAQVYDIGKLGDSYFFTMEYVHGETVRSLLYRAQAEHRQLPLPCVLTIVAGAAAGLHHAHERLGLDGRPLGIVHRDVSPSNLMVSYEGGVKLVDFGVAKAADRAEETKTGTVKGKISYLSPEQCKGRRVDRRSDLFSLGICFWEMLTTERLYKRASDLDNMNAIVSEPPPAPSSRRSEIPRELDELVLRLLAKSPDDRFQTADQLVDAVEQVAARGGSMLSASALGRFVRELFGPRPEPWLEVDRHREHGEAVTVTSEPVPSELVAVPPDDVDVRLSSVLDLSPPRAVTESLDSLGALGALPVDPTLRIGRPLFMPPPTPGPARMLPAATGLTLPDAGRSRLAPTTDVSVMLLASADVATASASEPRTPAPPRPTGTPVAAVAAEGLPPEQPSATERVRRRSLWPVLAAAGGAAVIATVAGLLWLRVAPTPSAPLVAAGPTAKPTEPVVGVAPAITVEPIPETETAGAGSDASGSERGGPGSGGIVATAPRSGPQTAPGGNAPTAPRGGPQTMPGGSALTAPRGGPQTAPRGSAPTAPRGIASSPRPRKSPVVVPAPVEPPDDPLVRAFEDHSYGRVLAACGAGPVTAEHASLCVMAACKLGDEVRARQRISAVSAGSRERLIEQCKQLGVEIAIKKPAAKPAVDCATDPMACPR